MASIDKYRNFVFTVLGDNECWVDCKDDIFNSSAQKLFASKNFDYFHYDPESKMMFVRPTMKMHKTTVDNLESLPNDYYTKELLEHGTGDVILMYYGESDDDEKEDSDLWRVETQKECTLEEFKKEHPNSVSLLI